jgi:hypothetical protein
MLAVLAVLHKVSGHKIVINAGLGRNLSIRNLESVGKNSRKPLPLQTISRRVFEARTFLVVHGKYVNVM